MTLGLQERLFCVPVQVITPTTWADHGPMEMEAAGYVVRDIVDTEKVVEVCVWMRGGGGFGGGAVMY